MKNNPNGAEILIDVLKNLGVNSIFGYPGGAILPVYDALFKQNAIRHYLVRHELGAVHAAEGYARATGKVGVVMVTSGPGITNTVTGLADALLDSVPIVCISGQVPTHLIGTDAFQECDAVGITRPCTKHNFLVRNVNKLAATVKDAFDIAQKGRPGPVMIDLPKDIQLAHASKNLSSGKHSGYQPQVVPHHDAIVQCFELLATAKAPLIYGGGGLINSGDRASELLTEFVNLTRIPTTLTLMGLGALPADHPCFLGMLGMHGSYEANLAMFNCDVMFAIGSRFDDRVTGRVSGFSPNSTKIHVDIDPSSINKTIMVDLPVLGDCASTLEALIDLWKNKQAKINLDRWWQTIDHWREKNCFAFKTEQKIIKPQQAIQALCEKTAGRNAYVTTEVGQHQMWAAQHFKFYRPRRFITSGGLGTMGFGLPAAIGIQVAHPEQLVIDIAGEASILMNIQELSTAVQYRLPVKVFILNNEYLGMVRQWQELNHEGRYSESYAAALPDFVKLAEAYGLTGVRASTPDQLENAIDVMLHTDGPVIADIHVCKNENCYPMIPAGACHNEMLLSPDQKVRPTDAVTV